MSPELIIAVAALILGPLVAYIGVVRRASGKIVTSEASELWDESRAIRVWATDRIRELNGIVDHLEEKIAGLEKAHQECEAREAVLRRRVSELEAAA